MIIGPIFAILCAVIVWLVLSASGALLDRTFTRYVFGGYILRLVLQFFVREVPFFSHVAGGDCVLYEAYGVLIAKQWQQTGVSYITADEGLKIGATSLPQNTFAFIIYLNGGESTRLGCTAVCALAAALVAINVYTLALEFGATRKNALLMSCIIYFQPAVLFYTCDLYKDGMVLCVALGALGSALRLSKGYSLTHAILGAVSCFLLWYVRFYLVFLTIAPLLVGVAGLGSKKLTRPILAALALVTAALALAAFTDILQAATERAADTFAQATSERSIMGNVKGEQGSGVAFDDGGSPFGALPQKLAYTLFAPFPWAGGSLGFQLGKLDGFLWYFIIYRAVRAWGRADGRLRLMILTFAVPCTVAYATTMANVGLIVRQRLIIVVAMSILASIYTPKPAQSPVMAPVPRPPPRRPRPRREPSVSEA